MDRKPTVWNLEEHTRAKHQLMDHYISAWFPIRTIQGHNKRVVFLDGFAGPGTYSDGEPGSPLIALEALVSSLHFDQLAGTTFEFVFVEKRPDRFRRLQVEISEFWRSRGGKPPNVNVHPLQMDFVDAASKVLPDLRGTAPMFAFIDPFGWSVPMAAIRDCLADKGCEVLFTFMHEYVNRFITTSKQDTSRTFMEMFGVNDDEYAEVGNLQGEKRKKHLRDKYLSQLRHEAGFEYVRPFEVRDIRRNRTIYFLMFGTHSTRGLDVMKQAMWKLDPEQGVLFAGLTTGAPLLFEPEPHLLPLLTAIQERFGGETVEVETIEEFVITETDFTSSHYKGILREMETEGTLECVSSRQRRYSYPPDCRLRILPCRQSLRPSLPFGS